MDQDMTLRRKCLLKSELNCCGVNTGKVMDVSIKHKKDFPMQYLSQAFIN